MKSGRITVVGLVMMVVFAGQVVCAQVSSTFNADLEGWRVTGDNSFTWESATGNPGGCLSVNDLAVGDMNYIIAPPAYHGDWSGMTAMDSISAEIYFQNTSMGPVVNPEYIFRIAGPGGAAHALVGPPYYPAQNVWNLYQVALDPAQWVIESGTWPEILQAVDSLRIMGEFVSGKEVVRLDNVHLSATPVEIFIPCEYDNFNTAGTGDWSFLNTNGVSNPDSGGNGGGYLSIDDGTGVSVALAPAKFLGDWSSLNNNGYITLDIRLASRGGTPRGVMEFIRLSGPGGSAHVNFNTSDLPESSLIWKTFTYPLNTSTWTVDSGTWAGLLAEVTECRMMPEFYDGSETGGLDNFGRLADSCPQIDFPVVVHDPGLTTCGQHSLVGVSNVAFNPRDGELYGLICTSSGGLYPVTGAGQGLRLQAYDRPAHVIFDYDGDGFISEHNDGIINRYAWGGGSSLWVSGFHSGDDDPYGMCFAPMGFNGTSVSQGDILVSDYGYSTGPDQIWSFSPDISEGERLVMPDPGNTDQYDLAADPDGPVYVCDALDANHLYRLAPNGTLTTLTLSSPVSNIYSLVYDGVEENIYIAGKGSKAIYRVVPSTGVVTLVADGFSDFSPCCLEIDPATRRLWVADVGYNRVYEFCLSGGVSVDISVALEGSARPADAGWQIPLWVGFFQTGADVLQDPALFYCHLTTTRSGDYAVAQVPGVAPGTYDLTVVSEHTLLNVKRSVAIAAPIASVVMGTLAEGNADDNNDINLSDFSVLASAWQTHLGQAEYRSQADFDRNGDINISDLALLCTNWLDASPLEIP